MRTLHSNGAARYFRPFEQLAASSARGLAVTHSLKLRRRSIEADRYFLRFDEGSLAHDCKVELERALDFPRAARDYAQNQLSGGERLSALGATLQANDVGYRFYYRSGLASSEALYGVGVDWRAGHAAFSVKTYQLLGLMRPHDAAEIVRRALQPDAGEERLLEGWLELLEGLCSHLQLLEVRDAESGRCSFDAGPAFERPLALPYALERAASWLACFDVAENELEPHHRREGCLENLALGRGDDGELFATLYHGRYRRPVLGRRPVALYSPKTASRCDAGARVYALGRLASERVSGTDRQQHGPESNLAPAESHGALFESGQLRWLFCIAGIPAYCLEPAGAFARDAHATLVEIMREQRHEDPSQRVEWVALAGQLTGERRHHEAGELPVVRPDLMGLRSWSRDALLATLPQGEPAWRQVAEFLAQLSYQRPNPGRLPEQRALNFLATQPAALWPLFVAAAARGLTFAGLLVECSRPTTAHAICQVILQFAPCARTSRVALHVAELAIDVERSVPAFVGASYLRPVTEPTGRT